MLGSEHYVFENSDDTLEELISGFIKQFYFTATNIPKEILIPVEIEDSEEIEKWLSEKSGHKIRVHMPKRGDKAHTITMVNKNAEESFKRFHNLKGTGANKSKCCIKRTNGIA